MKRERRQGSLVLLLALGLILGSGGLVYCVWQDPDIAVAIGVLCAVGGVVFWVSDALIFRFAPGCIIQRRIDRAVQGKWISYLCPYGGSGQLLEEYRREQESQEEDEGDGIFPARVALKKRERLQGLTLSVKASELQQLELKEGDPVLLILSGLTQGVLLLGTLDRLEQSREDREAYVTLRKGLICDRGREVFL